MNDAQKQWFRERVAAIHARATAYDVLRRHGINLQQGADDREEQFSCPFHGEDKKPSARVYPERDNSPSHVWCFVCQESGWDAIGLWKKFNNLTFGQALSRLEREYDLETPERAHGSFHEDVEPKNKTLFKRIYAACETRLVDCKPVYQAQNDMQAYLTAGSLLDRTKYRVDSGAWTPEKGVALLQTLLERIHAKSKACPGG